MSRRRREKTREPRFQCLPGRLQRGRQLEAATELVGRFVDRESRRVGRDLAANAVRLVEVDRTEIAAVFDVRDVEAGTSQTILPDNLIVIGLRADGDVVN